MRTSQRPDLPQVLRFGLVGAANTALGYGVIVILLLLELGDLIANVAGYAFGLGLSYALNSRWTFRQPGRLGPYVGVFFVSYFANLAVVVSARAAGFVDQPLTHLLGLCAYTLVFYVGSSRFVFAERVSSHAKPACGGESRSELPDESDENACHQE